MFEYPEDKPSWKGVVHYSLVWVFGLSLVATLALMFVVEPSDSVDQWTGVTLGIVAVSCACIPLWWFFSTLKIERIPPKTEPESKHPDQGNA